MNMDLSEDERPLVDGIIAVTSGMSDVNVTRYTSPCGFETVNVTCQRIVWRDAPAAESSFDPFHGMVFRSKRIAGVIDIDADMAGADYIERRASKFGLL